MWVEGRAVVAAILVVQLLGSSSALTTCRVTSIDMTVLISGSSETFRVEERIDVELRKVKEGPNPHGSVLSRALPNAGTADAHVCASTGGKEGSEQCPSVTSNIADEGPTGATLQWKHPEVERGTTKLNYYLKYDVPLVHVPEISILAIQLRRAELPFNFLVGGCSPQESTSVNVDLQFDDWDPKHHKPMCGDRGTAIYSRTGHGVAEKYCRICSKHQQDKNVVCQQLNKAAQQAEVGKEQTSFSFEPTQVGELYYSFGRILYNNTYLSPASLQKCNAILYDQEMSSWLPIGVFGDILFPFKAAVMIIITTVLFVAIYVRCPANCVTPQKVAVGIIMITDLVTVWGLSVFPMCAAASFFSIASGVKIILLFMVFFIMVKGWFWLDDKRRKVVYLPNVFKTYLVATKDFPYWFTGIMLLVTVVLWLHFVTFLELVSRTQMAALISCFLSINACLAVFLLVKDLKMKTKRKTALMRLGIVTLLFSSIICTLKWLFGYQDPFTTLIFTAVTYVVAVVTFQWAKPMVVKHLDQANEKALKEAFRPSVTAKYGF